MYGLTRLRPGNKSKPCNGGEGGAQKQQHTTVMAACNGNLNVEIDMNSMGGKRHYNIRFTTPLRWKHRKRQATGTR